MSCKECGSFAINHNQHGRDGSDADLCDVCFWRKRAAPLVTLTDEQIEQGAMKLAELFDYPWEHMPEKGKGEMRGNVQSVFEAMIAKNGGKS